MGILLTHGHNVINRPSNLYNNWKDNRWTIGSGKYYTLLAWVCLGLCTTACDHGVVHQFKYSIEVVPSNGRLVHQKYLSTRIVYYPNSSASFQLQLLVAGDVNPNPGPDHDTNDNHNRNPISSHQKIVYSRTQLMNMNTGTLTVPLSTWLNITSLGIQSKPSTHRGVRAGIRKHRNRSVDISHFLKFSLWNAHSVRNKTISCSEYVLDKGIDALFLTETWLNDSDNVIIGELCPPGYMFINVPSDSDNYGGIGVLYRCPLKFQIIPFNFKSATFEYTIISNTGRKIYYILIYRPPHPEIMVWRLHSFLMTLRTF